MAVTPGNEKLAQSYGITIYNSMIKNFNSNIKNNIPSNITYINMYSKMTKNPTKWATVDGVHYDSITYNNICIWTREMTCL